MYCTICGSEAKPNERFCTKCGAALPGAADRTMPVSAVSPPASTQPMGPVFGQASGAAAPPGQGGAMDHASGQVQGQGGAPGSTGKPAGKRSRKKAVVVTAVAVVVIAAVGIGVGLWWKSEQDAKAQAAWQRAHSSLITEVKVDAPGFDASATAIPVQVKGVDLDGNSVSEVQFLHPGAMYVSTYQGSYDLMFPGGYFTGAGKVCRAPDAIMHIQVDIDDEEGPDGEVQPVASSTGAAQQEVVFTEVPDLEVTDELIDEVRQWAGQDAEDDGKADQLASDATSNRDAAVAAEQERQRAEAEARTAARYEAALGFARQYYTNARIANSADDTKVEALTNWEDMVRSHLAPGSQALSDFNTSLTSSPIRGLGAACIVTSSSTISDDGTLVVVAVSYVGTQNPIPGWSTRPGHTATFTCTLSDDNLVSAYNISQ